MTICYLKSLFSKFVGSPTLRPLVLVANIAAGMIVGTIGVDRVPCDSAAGPAFSAGELEAQPDR